PARKPRSPSTVPPPIPPSPTSRPSWPAPGPGSSRPPEMDALVAFARRHPRLLVLTGAGCSVASGIPEYRDHEGTWKARPPVTYADFVTSAAVRRRYWARSLVGWERVAAAVPGAVHHALASLQRAGRVAALVTPNVDPLPPR